MSRAAATKSLSIDNSIMQVINVIRLDVVTWKVLTMSTFRPEESLMN